MKKKILVVEDDPTSCKLVSSVLKGHGYSVTIATDGEKGLKKAIEEKPDLIVLDVIMPKKDGYTFLRELKGKDYLHTPPVIMVTVKDQMEPTFRLEGVADYFGKPLETEKFIKRVDQLLGCPTCGRSTPPEGHLCVPIAQENKKCDWCGASGEGQRHLCNNKMKEMSHVCDTCGRTAVKAEYLCNPKEIK